MIGLIIGIIGLAAYIGVVNGITRAVIYFTERKERAALKQATAVMVCLGHSPVRDKRYKPLHCSICTTCGADVWSNRGGSLRGGRWNEPCPN